MASLSDPRYEDVDEELAPIIISEYMSVDDILEENPHFVALDDEYIEAFAGELLNNRQKGTQFLKMHKRFVVTPNSNSIERYLPFLQFSVSADRRDVSEDEDYFAKWKEYRSNAPYHTYNSEMYRISAPFEKSQDGPLVLDTQLPAKILLAARDPSILLPEDNTPLPISEINWQFPTYTKEHYIFEQDGPKLDMLFHKNDENLIDIIRSNAPKIETVAYGHATSIHELRKIVTVNGIDFDDITLNDFKVLKNHLETATQYLLQPSSQDHIAPDFSKTRKSKGIDNPFTSYEHAAKIYLERAGTYFTDSRQNTIHQAFDVFLSGKGAQGTLLQEVDTPFDMAMALLHDTYDVSSAAQMLRDVQNAENTKIAKKYFMNLQAFDSTRIETQLSAFKYINTVDPGKDVVRLIETEKFVDKNDIIQGLDTSKYFGIDLSRNIYVDNADMDALDTFDVTDGAYDVTQSDDVVIPIHSFRSPDHMVEPYKDILEISHISGLPWNAEAWLSEAFHDRAFPPSRYDALRNVSPHISDFVLQAIANANTERDGFDEIQRMSNKDEAQKISNAYRSIFETWASTSKEVMIDGLTFWAADTLEASLQGRLEFRVPNNNYAHFWSPYGIPVEPKAKRGVFQYIAKIANTDVETLVDYATEHYPSKMERIMKSPIKQLRTNNVQQAFMDVLAQHKTNKQKIEFFLPTFIPMYLNMPSNMSQKVSLKKQPPWAQGCCVVPLNNIYEADTDFRYTDDRRKKDTYLYSIKTKLADKRWLRSPRPSMYVIMGSNMNTSDSRDKIEDIATDNVSVTPIPSVDVRRILSDFAPNQHITDYEQGRYSAFNASMLETANKIAPSMTSLLDATMDINIYLTMIKTIVKTYKLPALLEIKQRIVSNMPVPIAKYLLVVAISNVPQSERNGIVDMLHGMATLYKIPTEAEAKQYIDKMREESKARTLKKLDVLSREERELAKYANQVGVAKYNTIPDINNTFEQTNVPTYDGESEYRQHSTDADEDNEDYA